MSKVDFIQIGSYIGNTPQDIIWPIIRKNNWRGIFVEPWTEAFLQLKDNYKDIDGCYFENVAIAEETGIRDLYCQVGVDRQQSSLLPTHFPNHRKRVECIQRVQCITLNDLVVKYNLLNYEFELLQIDAESYDGRILLSTDFTDILPKYIRFEYSHLCKNECIKIIRHLQDFGYKMVDDIFSNDIEVNNDMLMEKK